MRPNASTVRATTSSTWPASPTSQASGEGAAPLARTASATASSGGEAAAHRHHVGADLGQLDGDGAADALAGAGDDGDAVLEGVRRECHRQTIAATAPAANPVSRVDACGVCTLLPTDDAAG